MYRYCLIAQRRRHTAKSYISAKGSQRDRWVQVQPAVSFSLTFFFSQRAAICHRLSNKEKICPKQMRWHPRPFLFRLPFSFRKEQRFAIVYRIKRKSAQNRCGGTQDRFFFAYLFLFAKKKVSYLRSTTKKKGDVGELTILNLDAQSSLRFSFESSSSISSPSIVPSA